MLGPYIKSRGTRGTKMSANADLITVETYVQQGETIWKPFFHLWAKMLKKNIFWGYFGGPEGVFNDQTKVLKCHEDRITLDTYVQQGKTMDNKFYIYVKTLTSLAKWGPGRGGGASIFRLGPSWFTYTLH